MKLAGLLFLSVVVAANADTIKLQDIKRAIHGLSLMMEKTWTTVHDNPEERKPIFDLYTCLTLTKDLHLLVFNRTEIFIEDQRQTCSCRRVHGKSGNRLSDESTFTTDMFMNILLTAIENYEDSETLSESFTHFDNIMSSKKNKSHVQPQKDVLVRLTEMENAIQIITRFLVKRWALNMMNDSFVPIFELYTCTSLLKEVEDYVTAHPYILKQLNIVQGEWYTPCECRRLYEFAASSCNSQSNCSYYFSPLHTTFEQKIHKVTLHMNLPTEISRI